jgi:phosphohistidine phosphatase SixA
MRFRERATVLLCAASLAGGCGSGFRGLAYQRLADGAIGPPIPGVELTFVREDGASVRRTTTDAGGRYQVELPAARYYLRAAHPDFEDDWSAPGLGVVTGGSPGTYNVFLRPPQVTTVLVVRHGEKQNPASNDPAEPLSAAGAARAQALRDALFRAGVTAIYSTDTVRTRSTVEPLRARLELTTRIYATPAEVAASILADHRGDVVAVAAHSDTVGDVVNALGGAVPTAVIGDFDNLYAVSGAGTALKAVNLQYGADSTPDVAKNSGGLATLLLVRQVGGASPPEAARLLHAGRKAGVGAIHVNGGPGLVQPLATALGLTPQAFTPATLDALVDGILASPPASPVLIAGTRQDLQNAMRRAGAPTRILYDTDRNNLVLVTRLPSGAARAVSLLY